MKDIIETAAEDGWRDIIEESTTMEKEENENSKVNEENKIIKISNAIRTILECLGKNIESEDLKKTPERYAKALMYCTKGYKENPKEIVSKALFTDQYNDQVLVHDIEFYSLCQHHMLPFYGKIHIAYVPNGQIVGLSKLCRVAEIYARRLQVQERLTEQIAKALMETINPQGVAVCIDGTHMCMSMRGVKKCEPKTRTVYVTGCYEDKEKRKEFLSLIK